MRNVTARAQKMIGTIEGCAELDGLSTLASGWVGKLTRRTWVKNLLSGTWLGHQLHPALTDVPIGAWAAATVLDLTAGEGGADAARRLVGLGVLAAVPTVAAGAADWADTYGPEQRVGQVHAAANVAATLMQVASWMARRRGRRNTGAMLSILAFGVTGCAAYLGGHLSLGRGVGVNHTAFEGSVNDWTGVSAVGDLEDSKPVRVTAEGVPVVLVKRNGRVHALSAVCSHAGGPLDEGTVDEHGCLKCPWHGSEFRLAGGTVARGPATIPQPCWEVKIDAGRVLIRHPATA